MSFLGQPLQAQLKQAIHGIAKTSVRTIGQGWVPTLDGQWFKLPDDIYPWAYASVALGRYEKAEKGLVQDRLKPAPTIIEIGANIGYIARYAFLGKLEPNGRYICVEPNPDVLDVLRENMRHAQLRADASCSFEIVNAAICDPDHRKPFVEFKPQNDLCSHIVSASGDDVHHNDIITVPVMTFGALMEKHAPGPATLICDAEGAEISMVKEPDAFRNVREIVMELHRVDVTGRPETPESIVAALRDMGFVGKEQRRDTIYFSRDPA